MDTDSIMMSISIKKDSIDEYVELADEVGDIVNSTFPDFIKHAFNCPEDRKNTITTGREIVSDKSLFLSKKRYIMHVVDDEGERCDKLKIMGVELKKSDTAEAVKDMLAKVVNMILDDVSGEDIIQNIKNMKEDYRNYSIKDIARPISCKGLKKYQTIYEETGSKKGAPYQVRAAMFFNDNCTINDKKVVAGDKIGVVYIKNPKSKYVGFPIETNNLPEFVDDLIIDWDTQWDKAYKKLESYISAIGLDIKSRKKTIRQDLFGF